MNWIEINALHKLFSEEEVKLNETLRNSGEIRYLEKSRRAVEMTADRMHATSRFSEIYKKDYLQNYLTYESFLNGHGLLKPQTRFDESDIRILMSLYDKKIAGDLEDLRHQIISFDESLRGVSHMFFKNEKYLLNKGALIDALKYVLDIEEFSNEKDQQYIYKLECHNPRTIVLCENIDFLTKPNKPRREGIELWYAGGKNVSKLDYVDTRGLPIFYSGDWDYDGLCIIYPLVKDKIPSIELLTPNGLPKSVIDSEHKSLWKKDSKSRTDILDLEQKAIVESLIQNNEWIVEESNDLLQMLDRYN